VIGRRLKLNWAFFGYTVVVSLLLCSIFRWEVFPTCFVEGTGLTLFKKASEYAISVILLLSMFLLFRKRKELDANVVRLLIASMGAAIVAELAFTLYEDPYAPPNTLGHLLTILSFFFIYRAIIETSLAKPYDVLFRELKTSEESLRRSEAEFRLAFESAKDAIFWADADTGLITSVVSQ